jgi:hypothetical protein
LSIHRRVLRLWPSFADVLNVFNDAYEWMESQLGTADNFATPAGFIVPRRAMLGAKIFF